MKKGFITLLRIYLFTIAFGVLQKIIFLIAYFSESSQLDLGTLFGVIWNGLILDISTAGYITILPMLALIIATWCGYMVSDKVWHRAAAIYLTITSIIIAVISSVDLNLYRYWGYRVDATLIPYLLSPSEAAASLGFLDYVIALSSLSVLLVASFFGYRWAIRGVGFTKIPLLRRGLYTLSLLLLSGFIFIGIRGGVDESVANVSKVYFSKVQFANHAAVNPSFSLLSSISKLKNYDEMYPFYDSERAYARVLEARPISGGTSNDLNPWRPNILFIIGESFTKAIMESEVEGRAVMPRLKEIAAEGLYFENCFATGARTDRGVVSVLSAFPSQPTISIMKIPSKSRNLPSIAKSLTPEGYSTHFYYGGDLDFMDMSSYLYSTSWQHLSSLSNLPRANEPRTKWGNSDGAMSVLVADSLEVLTRRGAPFLASWLTISSHEPFDMPEDFGFSDPRINSMAYADAKVGDLVDDLRGDSKAWDNLLIVIVGDHTLGYPTGLTYNSPLRHRIPLIFSGGAVDRLEKLDVNLFGYVSQMDIVPTIVSAMGLDRSGYRYGRDIFRGDGDGFGYYTFSDGGAIVRESGATIYDHRGGGVYGAESSGTELNDLWDQGDLELLRSFLQVTHEDIGDKL